MTSHDMSHLKFLATVAAADVEHVEKKEATYQGSWKRRGGVGVFMMLARKWDRLESILKGRWNYDIFEAVRTQCANGDEGADGTVLAEIRDLRRYLLLAEAEMVSRGVVAAAGTMKPSPLLCCVCVLELDSLSAYSHGGKTYCHAHYPNSPVMPRPNAVTTRADLVSGLADDAAQHSSLAPWIMTLLPRLQEFYEKRGPTTWRLKTHMPWSTKVEAVAHLPYLLLQTCWGHPAAWVLNMSQCPPEARDQFPVLPSGLNHHEWNQMPDGAHWQRLMYDRLGDDEYRIRRSCQAWSQRAD